MNWSRVYWKWHVEIGLAAVTVFLSVLGLWLYSLNGDVSETQRSLRTTITELRSEAQRGAHAESALCALRSDKRREVGQSIGFLKAHPNGAFGFSRAAILVSIGDEKQTLRSLRGLKC